MLAEFKTADVIDQLLLLVGFALHASLTTSTPFDLKLNVDCCTQGSNIMIVSKLFSATIVSCPWPVLSKVVRMIVSAPFTSV